jgi:hypothetical protein
VIRLVEERVVWVPELDDGHALASFQGLEPPSQVQLDRGPDTRPPPLEPVTHESSSVHRLDRRRDWPAAPSLGPPSRLARRTNTVRRRQAHVQRLRPARQQTAIQTLATEIQPGITDTIGALRG